MHGENTNDMCMEDQFKEFKQALSKGERDAIQRWLGIWYDYIRTYQRTGIGDTEVVEAERNLKSALNKAVVCKKTVYRGLSAGSWRPEEIAYMRNLVEGPNIYELPCHDSASVMESIGRAFTYIEPDDEERNMAVLLIAHPKTARYLAPFQHNAKNEGEVVLLQGTKFKRVTAVKKPDPKPNLEYWELQVEEIA
jgi:hypothetical protein